MMNSSERKDYVSERGRANEYSTEYSVLPSPTPSQLHTPYSILGIEQLQAYSRVSISIREVCTCAARRSTSLGSRRGGEWVVLCAAHMKHVCMSMYCTYM